MPQEHKAKPKNTEYYTLAFIRKPELFPQPNSLVGVPQHIINEHLVEMEEGREQENKDKSYIGNKFLEQSGIHEQVWYDTEVERKCKAFTPLIPLEIIEIIPAKGKNAPMMAVCSLRMFLWPKDVIDAGSTIELPINYLMPIEPVLCNSNFTISDEKPDGVETFGRLDKAKDFYRIYKRAYDVSLIDLVPLLKDLGLKEFSKIVKFPTKVDNNTTPIKDDIIDEDFGDIAVEQAPLPDEYDDDDFVNEDAMLPGKEYIDLLKVNPLYKYTKAQFINLVQKFKEAEVMIPEDLVNLMYFSFFDTMLRTGVPESTKLTLSQEDKDNIRKVQD